MSQVEMYVPLSRPEITDLERAYVLEVLSTPDLSLGPKLAEFEKKLAEYVGARHAIAVNSGTSALHLAIRALGIGEGDEVITTPFSFVASSNCILFERARPVFVDIDPDTLNIDVEAIEAKLSERTKAILAVDLFGHPADWARLRDIADRHRIQLIEDSCEALGAEYRGTQAGTLGDIGAFAFYPNKQITTGEGGAIVTDDPEIAALCRSMRNQGRSIGDEAARHVRLGYNYRISDINCALGLAQLERIDEILMRRTEVAARYRERLDEVNGVEPPGVSPEVKMSWFVYVIRLTGASRRERDRVIDRLESRGISCGHYFQPIHLEPFYRNAFGHREGEFPVTEAMGERTIALPFYNRLTEAEIDYVVEGLREVLTSLR